MISSPALAYVFWHWILDDAQAHDYEQCLTAFQASLLAHAPQGSRRAAVFRHAPAPWLPDGVHGYVDWYVVDASAALDALNDAAVSPACRTVHDAAAVRSDGGSAGLYALRSGALCARRIRVATWFSKPAGMSYAALDACVAERVGERPFELWSRRMVLGPTPEMCVLGSAPLALPDACNALHVCMDPIWSSTRGASERAGER